MNDTSQVKLNTNLGGNPSVVNDVNPPKTNNKKVLIVEDEQDAASILKMNLESSTDFKVFVAHNGKEGLEIQSKEFCELVLLDIIMPVMDGMEALKELREHPEKYGKPMIYILTNLTGEMAEDSVKKYKADGFIVKVTNEPDDIVEIVKDAFKQREAKASELPKLPQ